MTSSYKVVFKKNAEKELRGTPKKDLLKILEKAEGLMSNPRPHDHTKLSGEEQYRIRYGDWRIVYGIDDDLKLVTIVKIGHRREIYG